MPRSGADARRRLREAALDLFEERGYDAVTAAEIAARAGVTERTYFRHFADKREALFDGETELNRTLAAAIAESTETQPLDLVLYAYTASVPLFVAGRRTARRRAAIVSRTPALQERAHAKSAAIMETVVRALETRGIAEPTARLAARVGAAVFERAMLSWDGTATGDLGGLITTAAAELDSLR